MPGNSIPNRLGMLHCSQADTAWERRGCSLYTPFAPLLALETEVPCIPTDYAAYIYECPTTDNAQSNYMLLLHPTFHLPMQNRPGQMQPVSPSLCRGWKTVRHLPLSYYYGHNS
ncbi:hypothetical protein [Prevotella denticola]|uniref:hypothetical protein n=1 Tax=Prevotella denticola TaxID=28129 RepID=UPI000A9CD816|nr:hypothetical protein [Prevotella denticola]